MVNGRDRLVHDKARGPDRPLPYLATWARPPSSAMRHESELHRKPAWPLQSVLHPSLRANRRSLISARIRGTERAASFMCSG